MILVHIDAADDCTFDLCNQKPWFSTNMPQGTGEIKTQESNV